MKRLHILFTLGSSQLWIGSLTWQCYAEVYHVGNKKYGLENLIKKVQIDNLES